MILKKITLLGFKSFADKVDIILNKGITGFVGPNGCGKSNIVDAIRWVLGEQSIKILRGSKTEDVIFHGCDSRKSLGLAEVSLTFDNEEGKLPIDFSEVMVTRRLFRSGESQYLINKTICRLKDVQQLFMDTGIGTSSYSIIEQGEMDWIINAKPHERREIFEEASGITKYKNKKKEALRKLKYAEDNLLRLKDIIAELSTQIRSLSRQASKARRFKKLTNELQFLDSQHTLHLNNEYKNQIDNYTDELIDINLRLEELKNKINCYETNFHTQTESYNDLDLKYKNLTEQKYETENKINQLKQANEFKTSRIQDIEKRLNEENTDKQNFELKNNELEDLKEHNYKLKKDIDEEFSAKKLDIEKCNVLINRLTNEIESKKNFIFDFKEKLDSIKNQSIETNNKIIELDIIEKNLIQNKEKVSDEVSDINLSLNFEEDQLASVEEKSNSLKVEIENVTNDIEVKDKEYKDNSNIVQTLETEMMNISSKLTEKSSRKDALQDLKDTYEGFYSGVRAVMLKSKEDSLNYPGIIGVVSDIIKVDQGYEVAVEAALGARIQNIVVENGKNAKTAIEFLKKHRLGRVTFLPIDLVKFPYDLKDIPNNPKVIGRLVDYIKYDDTYNNIILSLLANYLVVNNLDDALSLKREGVNNFNIITLSGEIIANSGSITGGDISSSVKGILSRDNEIDELEEEINKFRNKLIQNNDERNRLKAIKEQCSMDLDKLKESKTNLTYSYQSTEKELQRIIVQRDSLKKRLDYLYKELELASNKMNDIVENKDSLVAALSESTSEDENIKETIIKHEIELEELYNDLTSNKQNLAKDQTILGNLIEKVDSLDNRICEIDKEIKERHKWLNNLQINHDEQVQNIACLKDEIEKSNLTINDLLLQDTNISTDINKIRETLDTLKNQIDDFEVNRKNIQSEMDSINERNTAIKVQIAEIEGKLNNLHEHLFDKYELHLNSIEDKSSDLEIEWDEIPSKINELDSKIKNLGNVNLEAINELEALQTRFEFLDTQEKDLSQAKTQLLDVIDKINVTATIKFEETFEKVKVYFNDIFKELFQGGKAELRLLDNGDLLEAGIEIIARPPGKNFQSISLLSGGEKALTATALLFALFKVKASPFCFIDELDAPLDDNNILRFTNLLTKFSATTQFFIVTHNKNTLKIVDLLYGITQQEKGISKLISIKFIDENLDHLLEEAKPIKSKTKSKAIQIKEDEELQELVIPKMPKVELQDPSQVKPEDPALKRIENDTRIIEKTEIPVNIPSATDANVKREVEPPIPELGDDRSSIIQNAVDNERIELQNENLVQKEEE